MVSGVKPGAVKPGARASLPAMSAKREDEEALQLKVEL
jgi:hypothetical protein